MILCLTILSCVSIWNILTQVFWPLTMRCNRFLCKVTWHHVRSSVFHVSYHFMWAHSFEPHLLGGLFKALTLKVFFFFKLWNTTMWTTWKEWKARFFFCLSCLYVCIVRYDVAQLLCPLLCSVTHTSQSCPHGCWRCWAHPLPSSSECTPCFRVKFRIWWVHTCLTKPAVPVTCTQRSRIINWNGFKHLWVINKSWSLSGSFWQRC